MMLNILEIYLQKKAYKYLRIDGSVSQIDRQSKIDDFNDLS